MSLTPNTLAFTALANEYCAALENAPEAESAEDFIREMLRLLPRIYISAADLPEEDFSFGSLSDALDEYRYNAVRDSLASLLGEDDTFLEVFQQDMKYSDTPIAASISESLSDIFQVLYNYLETVRDAPEEVVETAVSAVKEEFKSYWSTTLCNVLRPLNAIRYQI